MPQRRKQQKGAGLFDIFSSDPAKKIIANNTRIEELKKESEQKCDELKKKIGIQIRELEQKNVELQKAVDANKAEAEKKAESGSVFDRFTNMFGSSADDAKTGSDAAGPGTGLVGGPGTGPGTGPVGGPGTGPGTGPQRAAEHVGETGAGPEAHVPDDRGGVPRRRCRASGDRVHLAGQEVDVVLDHVETSRRRRQPGDPIHPDHPAASRWQRQGV